MEGERPQPPPPSESEAPLDADSSTPLAAEPGELPGVYVPASPLRCPFCHDGVDPTDSDWVACRGCLARHHSECWDEGGACGVCGGDQRLVMEASSVAELAHPSEYWRERARALREERPPRPRPRVPTAARRRLAASPPADSVVARYLQLQAGWALSAAILAGLLHPWLALLGGGLGLLSSVQLALEARRDPALTRMSAGLSLALVAVSFLAAAHALATDSGLVAALGLLVVAGLAFGLSLLWGRRR